MGCVSGFIGATGFNGSNMEYKYILIILTDIDAKSVQ